MQTEIDLESECRRYANEMLSINGLYGDISLVLSSESTEAEKLEKIAILNEKIGSITGPAI